MVRAAGLSCHLRARAKDRDYSLRIRRWQVALGGASRATKREAIEELRTCGRGA
jgi:hypothetical protein